MSYQIVTDSACNLTEETIDTFGLEILPLTFMVDGVQHRSYLKGEKTDLRQFYTMMREGKVITTSLPNMQETETTLRRVLDAGHDVLYLGFERTFRHLRSHGAADEATCRGISRSHALRSRNTRSIGRRRHARIFGLQKKGSGRIA